MQAVKVLNAAGYHEVLSASPVHALRKYFTRECLWLLKLYFLVTLATENKGGLGTPLRVHYRRHLQGHMEREC
jgi:hypothetical protein